MAKKKTDKTPSSRPHVAPRWAVQMPGRYEQVMKEIAAEKGLRFALDAMVMAADALIVATGREVPRPEVIVKLRKGTK